MEEMKEHYAILVDTEGSETSWSPSGNPPLCPVLPSSGVGARLVAIGNQLYKSGGEKALQDCYEATLGQKDWSALPKLNVGRFEHGFTAVGGTLVVTGGYSGDDFASYGKSLSSVEILQPGQTAWTTAPWSLKQEIHFHCAVAWPGSSTELVVLGGASGIYGSADVTKYNILTGERSSLPSLPEPVIGHACTIYKDQLVVSGGYHTSSKVWQLEGDQWVALPPLSMPRYKHVMGVLGGELYVLGGRDAKTEVEKFDGTSWQRVEPGLAQECYGNGAIFVN